MKASAESLRNPVFVAMSEPRMTTGHCPELDDEWNTTGSTVALATHPPLVLNLKKEFTGTPA